MKADGDYKTVFKRALRILARRDHAKNELKTKLASKTQDIEVVDKVLDKLEENGYLDDRAFAVKYLRYRSELGFGPKKIFSEMKNKGIDEQNIQESFDKFDSSWVELAKHVFQKKFGGIKDVEKNPKDHEKKIRFLAHRGFSYNDIKVVLGEHSL